MKRSQAYDAWRAGPNVASVTRLLGARLEYPAAATRDTDMTQMEEWRYSLDYA